MRLLIDKYIVRHKGFREMYRSSQMARILFLGIILTVYALIGIIFMPNHITKVYSDVYGRFIFLLIISLLMIIGGKCYDYLPYTKKGSYCETITFFSVLAYSIWGLSTTYYSIVNDREINIITTLIVYAIFVLMLNVWLWESILLTAFNMIGTYYVLFITRSQEKLSLSMMVNYLLLGIVLLLIGIIRYRADLMTAFKEAKLNETIDETVALNQELNALNEELLTNQEIMEHSYSELERLNNSQKIFTASMHHELRSPLNGILGSLKILELTELTDEQKNCVSTAMTSTNNLLSIVNDLLDYSKIESGEFDIVPSNFDFKTVIDGILQTADNLTAEKGLILIKDIPDSLPCNLYGDYTRIQQIMTNLISNAIKYTQKGSVTVSIRIVDNILSISVKDTGIGMSEDVMSKLFKPYQRVDEKKNKAIQGTGLGLFIVKSLTEKMDGRVFVESVPGQGSTFKSLIKISVIDNTLPYKRELRVKKEKAEITYPDYSSYKILTVDDSKVNLQVAKSLLFKTTKAKVDVAISGESCINMIKSNDYDIILMDHLMPDMDGVDTLKAVRKLGYTMPIIALTANAGNEMEDKYRRYGFDDYLAKPIIIEKLVTCMDKLLKR